jgi:5-methylcytosine-specific restriction endonuclease McrA
MKVDDHIIPIEQGGSVDDLTNHQSLCLACHGVKRAAESRGQRMVVVQGKGLVVA